MMATDTITSTREDTARGTSGTKGEVAERERNLESRRETRRANLTRRSPYFGTTASPFSLMRTMADDIERLFSDVDFARVGFGLQSPQRLAPAFEPWRSDTRLSEATWAPQVETFKRGGNLVVRVDLPGLSKENVTVEADDDVLMISGERSDETKEEQDDYYRSERAYGRFFRAIPLPEGCNTEQLEATFKDGVLEVTCPAPKLSSTRHRQIRIR
jgi:HSP20 family protein